MYGQLQESVEVGEVEEESFRENSRYKKKHMSPVEATFLRDNCENYVEI